MKSRRKLGIDSVTAGQARCGGRLSAPGRPYYRGAVPPGTPSAGGGGIAKPLPPQWFLRHGGNAEMRWDTLAGTGLHTPNERFFVRNHTRTPRIDPETWRLRVHGSGLRGAGAVFSLAELRALPSVTLDAVLECAGNGRRYWSEQQGTPAPGTAWGLGGVGMAAWRGVPLGELLERAGLRPAAVDVLPGGLDPEYRAAGRNLGRVRRPLPIGKALDDVLVAYEMNGQPLPPDHGGPARLVVPGWVGVASIKWLGSVEVADRPLESPWTTAYYRLFGPGQPAGGGPALTRQTVKSAFELAPGAVLAAGRTHRLRGRSWSGAAAVRAVEVSTDGGRDWYPAELLDQPSRYGWRRWAVDWRPAAPGRYGLRARATDLLGRTQPAEAPFNREGYLFDAVVVHPVTVV
ncbi:molybdopterin-dependent oxidoreductase-like protein [Streptomyces sp. TLI_235]|nr:sulfite oxidase [Streptomyces sp. TLI_235]PBC76626.1 molybdopterin-dependent oxidoreductase-like protein [Streptomyces sp. TLI_235]